MDSFSRALLNSISNFERELNATLDRIAIVFRAKVQLKTPVDTGTLRRSFMIENGYELYSRVIYSDIPYSIFQEAGTRNFAGRYMMTRSIVEMDTVIDKEFEIMFRNLWK